ncbi:hypothetical protein QJQ45_014628 [Haematococcus lacustris]|nr:hypothetical protein QJQ45_014628 [Haematococcus lacustris]
MCTHQIAGVLPLRAIVALRQYDPAPRPKQDLEQLVSAVEELPFLSSSRQVEQTSWLLWCFADWARQPENRRAHLTQAQCSAVLALLQRMAGGAGVGKAGRPAPPPALQQFDVRQLSMAAWSLGKLRPHLPAAAVTSACNALASHSASSEAMKRGGWRDWSTILHGLATAGMQCSSIPDLTRLSEAVQLLPEKLAWGAVGQDISMTLWAMAKSGYTGSAQPLLHSVTAAISQGEVMRDARPQAWANLIWATSKLPGCREEARQLLDQLASRAQAVVSGLDAQSISNILYAMGMVLWQDKEVCRLLAERAVLTQQTMKSQEMANSLYGLARLRYLDSSVRSLAAGVAKADLAAFETQHLANLLYARSVFLALSIHQAVSSGHSQLASEPQLNSMAAALWRECSRRGMCVAQLTEEVHRQLYIASQWLHACTGGQISLAALPELAANVPSRVGLQKSLLCLDLSQVVQALAAAGHVVVQQAALSKDGTYCSQLLVQGPGLTRGMSVEQSLNFLPDGCMSGVVAYVKLQQLTHFDAGVVVNQAVFDQLVSDSERAAFMREQVRASLPQAEAWRQLLQAEGGHGAGQEGAPAAATPAAQQQQAVSVSAGQQARQQGALPLPAAQAKSAGALPSQRAGQAPGLMPRPVRPRPTPRAAPPWQQQAAGAGAAPGLPTPPAEQQGVRAELDTSSTRKRRAAQRQYDPAPRPKQDLEQLVSAVEKLPFLSSVSQVEQTSWLLWCFADWAKQPENRRAHLTQSQQGAVMALLQRMAGGAGADKDGGPRTPPALQHFDARQLSLAAWSLGKLKPHLQPHLPAAAVTSACTTIASHSASSEGMRRAGWRDWSNLLYGLTTAGMQCSSSPDMSWLCGQAVQLLPEKLAWGADGQSISMTLWAMAKSGYTGSAQPLLQSVTAAISQGEVMQDDQPQQWANLIWAASKLPGCREEARQLLDQFAVRAPRVVLGFNAQHIGNILYSMSQVLWHDKEVCRQLADRAAQTQKTMNSQNMANSLYGLARLGYLDSSVRSLAEAVAKAGLTAFDLQHITNLLYARSMFLALSNRQCHQVTASWPLLVQGPGLTLGISVDQSPNFLPNGRVSGVVAHAKLQQLTHFDAGVIVNKAVFDQLASDSERAAFMREQVRASLPEAEAWRQLLQAEGGHGAGQEGPPAAATPAAQQQQAVSVSAGQQARQQGALPLPAAQAKSAGALPSQRAGQAPGLKPRPVRPRV